MNLLKFPIIDPHIHQWDPYSMPHKANVLVKLLGRYHNVMRQVAKVGMPKKMLDTVGNVDHVISPYLPADYLQDCGRFEVESVVHVEADWHGHGRFAKVDETIWVDHLPFGTQYLPNLGGIIGSADPASPRFEQVLQRHLAASPRFRGIRAMASNHPDPGVFDWYPKCGRYTDPAFLKGFALLEKYQLRFDAFVYSGQLPDVTWLASRFPQIPIVLDHLGTPAGVFGPVGKFTGRTALERQHIFNKWKYDIALLAEQKHVHVKMSGLFMPVLGHQFHRLNTSATVDQIVKLISPFVDHAIDVFGYERLIFASNFPMDKPSASLENLIEAYASVIHPHGEHALKAIFRENALKFYGLNQAITS
mgnify:CR=1 FL=1